LIQSKWNIFKMPSTRSKAVTEKPTATKGAKDQPAKREALQSVPVPHRTFILPAKRSGASRFLTLPNPSSGALSRYFFDPQAGLYEFTAVSSTQFAPKSILLTAKDGDEGEDAQKFKSYVLKKAELLIATPIDVLFFMLPIVAPADNTGSTSNMFQPLDDILDSQDELSPHLRHILYDVTFRPTLERRMQAICDVMDAADETLYRFNEQKLVNELIAKANRMVTQGLPPSLEENFIRRALEPPLMSVKRDDVVTTSVSISVAKEDSQDVEVEETQSTSTTTVSTVSGHPSGVSTPATQPSTVDEISSSESNARLLRLRIALSFMKNSYLPIHLVNKVDDALKSSESPIDFTPLDTRLKELAGLRAEAIASHAIGDYTRKRGFEDDDVEHETKHRKEEEKKKATESRGVRELKKVNTSGMKKMSDFFKKKS
jgi:Ydr279p protein family (RNase H2 complex component) wHTH domain/Ydr279p protein triple barrel domain